MKFRKIIISLILVIALFSPILSGCDLTFQTAYQLRTPVITIHENDKYITWKEISGADNYDIYLNSKLASNVDSTKGDTCYFDFASMLTKTGRYEFYIVAKSDKKTIEASNPSNVVGMDFVYNEIILPETPEDIDETHKITFSLAENVSENILTYEPLEDEDVDSYVLYLYSNTTGLKTYELSVDSVSLRLASDVSITTNNPTKGIYYIQKGDIYAIRMGYKKDDKTQVASDIIYYNGDEYAPYTDKIYLFDGYIHDYYIDNMQELKNLVYYSFINKLTTFDFKLSNGCYNTVNDINGSSMEEKLHNAICQCFESFSETFYYQANNANGFVKIIDSINRIYNVKISYFNVSECDVNIDPMPTAIYEQVDKTQYYETITYETRAEKYGENYNNFVSDKQFLYTEVETSEQLYWAVENKVTPIIKSNTSRAYQIYWMAKKVINSIIADEMTDYEKALSLFEWILVNTQYDHTTYSEENGYTAQQVIYHNLPCFYLEGVFITGYAVCDGFSKAYSLMCNMIGIDCIRIVGTARSGSSSGGHAWNKVKLDKDPTDAIEAKYYLVDITWSENVVEEKEIPDHSYFLLSDEVVTTHFDHEKREKFKNYKAEEHFGHYEYYEYSHKGITKSLVVDADEDLNLIFDYLLVNSFESIEFIVDLNYMKQVYANTHGTYYPLQDQYYAKLKNVFAKNAMKSNKFNEQYLIFTNSLNPFVYNENGNLGIIYVVEQYLLIDESNEVKHMVEYFDANNIVGTYYLYVDNDILQSQTGGTDIARVKNLFLAELAGTDLNMSFIYYSSNVEYGDESSKASYYKVIITQDDISSV